MTGRRSRWFPSDAEPRRWISSTETDFLFQDFHNHIVPYRHGPDPYGLSTEGIPAQQVEAALSLGDYAWRLEGFLRAVASRLLTHHEVWLEVTFEDGNGNRTPFQVCEVDGVRQTEEGNLIQELPSLHELPDWSWDRGDDEWEEEVELDADRMVQVRLPDAYSSHLLMQVVRDLAEVDTNMIPARVIEQLTGQRQDAPAFDASEAYRTERLRILQAALPIGWTAREIFFGSGRQVSDYYHYWRELRFLHFRASMRTRAEEALRQVLTLACERCGFAASVTAHGLYAPHEVQELIRKFEAGEFAFAEMHDLISEKANNKQVEQGRVLFEVRPSGRN